MSTQANTVPNDPQLAALIARVESGDNRFALRFEPKTYAAIIARPSTPAINMIMQHNQCSLATARVLYSMSFGAYQLMGFNLYELGYPLTVGAFLNSASDQFDYFFHYLDAHAINEPLRVIMTDPLKLRAFAVAYNGSDAYAERMKAFYHP